MARCLGTVRLGLQRGLGSRTVALSGQYEGGLRRKEQLNWLLKHTLGPKLNDASFARREFSSVGRPLMASVKDEVKADVHPSKSKVIISRVMGPDDTQMYGMVHGGVIMQLLEEAGTILTMQYCNTNGHSNGDGAKVPRVMTVSGCMERAELLQSMFLGEVAEVHAEIGYTSPHSVQVVVEVYARNVIKGEKRLTTKAKIWYVPLSSGKDQKIVSPPPMTYADPKMEAEGKMAYVDLKRLRDEVIRPRLDLSPKAPEEIKDVAHDPERGSVNYSRVVTRHAIHPSSCWAGETYLRGGVAMKWMDEAGSLSASLHSSYPAFTIGVDTIMFLRKLRLGGMMVVTSKPIFVSQRSMEILITGDELSLHPGRGIFLQRAVEAIFTFVASDGKGRATALPPLKLKTEEEVRLFEERKKLYEKRQNAKK